MANHTRPTRRQLLQSAGAFGIPTLVPSGVLGMNGRQGANDRIVTAVIGVGGMGSSHIQPDTAALCDVDANHLAQAATRVTAGTPMLVTDFRRILDRKDIDAVFIATPDHWHAVMTVMACQAGKHVYCEKPTARTIEEGRAMVNAARRYRRVVQIGAQGRSHPNAALACQYVRNGGIGRIKQVDIWHPSNFTTTDWAAPQLPPSTLDWDMWLGPARWRPYHPLRCHFNFRWFWDFGAGFLRDRGNHALSIVSWLTRNDDYKGVVTVRAVGQPHLAGCFETPVSLEVTWEFEDPAWVLTWRQPGAPNPRFPGEWGATYTGDRGDLVVLGGDGGCDTEPKAKEYRPSSGGEQVSVHPVEADATQRHRLNFLDSIRSGKRPCMDVEIGHHVVTLCNLGNIAYRLGRTVRFDFATERFLDDEMANRMLSEPNRAPWQL